MPMETEYLESRLSAGWVPEILLEVVVSSVGPH